MLLVPTLIGGLLTIMTLIETVAFPSVDFAAMSTDAKVALIGLLGTILGALFTGFGNALSVWGQSAAARRARREHLADRRFDTHLGFLNSANEVLDCARNLGDALKQYDSYTSEQRQNIHGEYLASWNKYFISANSVNLAGPDSLMEDVKSFQEEMTQYSDFIDVWYKFQHDATRRAECSINRDAKVTKVNNARRAYVGQARGFFEKF